MRVLVDGKNFVAYGRGISQFVEPLLQAWFAAAPEIDFYVVSPRGEVPNAFSLPNVNVVEVKWPGSLPSALKHIYFDQVAFPRAIMDVQPKLVFCPFHDVRVPRKFRSVVMVHDMCLKSHQRLYQRRVSSYYLYGLRQATRNAQLILTDSKVSVEEICRLTSFDRDRIRVVPNGFSGEWFSPASDSPGNKEEVTQGGGRPRILYNGGWDRRKNTENLLLALIELKKALPTMSVLFTGQEPDDLQMRRLLRDLGDSSVFAQRLSVTEMLAAYDESDLVVYPSVCEGFGRVVVEAALRGARLACSDIPVFHELVGDYPQYFDPMNPSEIAAACQTSLLNPKPVPLTGDAYRQSVAEEHFLSAMSEALS